MWKRLVFLAALIVLGAVSLLPQEVLPQTGLWDKWEHLLAYLVLGLCGFVAFPEKRHRLPVLFFILAYGAALELLQGVVPGRVPSLYDAVANSIGAGLGLLAIHLLGRKAGRKAT